MNNSKLVHMIDSEKNLTDEIHGFMLPKSLEFSNASEKLTSSNTAKNM